MPIGNRKDATYAAELEDFGLSIEAEQAGWKYAGSGGTRTAYVSPEGIVYKVGCPENNRMEAERMQKFGKRKPVGVIRFPKTSLWNVPVARGHGTTHQPVVAMEYVQKDADAERHWRNLPYHEGLGKLYGEIADAFELTDMFIGNIIVAALDRLYIVDAGEW